MHTAADDPPNAFHKRLFQLRHPENDQQVFGPPGQTPLAVIAAVIPALIPLRAHLMLVPARRGVFARGLSFLAAPYP
jgi:hypothetical protein